MGEQGYKGLRVYQEGYKLAMEVFFLSKSFPSEEKFSLTSQIRRSSRSVCSNIVEGYRKRVYPKHFSSKMTDADQECSETMLWLDFARDCGYISEEIKNELQKRYEKIGGMLGTMAGQPEKFLPRKKL
jgi:four helix bundle protein